MRLVLVLLLAGCGGQHLVGAVELCCFSFDRGESVPSCDVSGGTSPPAAPNGPCTCLPELCSAGAACTAASDCATMKLPESKCADGTVRSPSVDCVAGSCRVTPPRCSVAAPAQTCSRDVECEQVSGCLACADGSRACYVVRCNDGSCQTVPPSCGCSADADCGDPGACSLCADGKTKRCLRALCVVGQCLVVPGPACPGAREIR